MLRLHSRRTAPVKRYAPSQIRSEFRNTFTEYIRHVLYAAFQYDSHVIEYRGTKIGYALRGNISFIFFSFFIPYVGFLDFQPVRDFRLSFSKSSSICRKDVE